MVWPLAEHWPSSAKRPNRKWLLYRFIQLNKTTPTTSMWTGLTQLPAIVISVGLTRHHRRKVPVIDVAIKATMHAIQPAQLAANQSRVPPAECALSTRCQGHDKFDDDTAHAFHQTDFSNRRLTAKANIGGVDMQILVISVQQKALLMQWLKQNRVRCESKVARKQKSFIPMHLLHCYKWKVLYPPLLKSELKKPLLILSRAPLLRHGTPPFWISLESAQPSELSPMSKKNLLKMK